MAYQLQLQLEQPDWVTLQQEQEQEHGLFRLF